MDAPSLVVISIGPLQGSVTLFDFGPCVDLERSSILGKDGWELLSVFAWIDFGVKDNEAEGSRDKSLLGGRELLRSVDGSFTLRTADLAVCFILLLPVPVGWLWTLIDVDVLGEPNGLKSEVAVAWVRGRIGMGRGPCGEPHRSAAVEPLFPFTPVI